MAGLEILADLELTKINKRAPRWMWQLFEKTDCRRQVELTRMVLTDPLWNLLPRFENGGGERNE